MDSNDSALYVQGTDSKKIVGYYANWSVYDAHKNYTPDKIPWGKLTHLNYAFAKISDGLVVSSDPYSDFEKGTLSSFKTEASKHPNVKTLISIGGWALSAGFHDAAATGESHKRFTESAINFMRTYGFAGIDIDWEHPTIKRKPDNIDTPSDQGTPYADESEKQTYTLLLRELRNGLADAGKADGKTYLLTSAVGVGKSQIAGTELETYHNYLDFINLMTYDIIGGYAPITGHQSALFPNPKAPEHKMPEEYTSIDEVVKTFLKAGVPNNKIIIGSPFYTKGWKNVKNDGPVPELPGLFASAEGSPGGIWDGGVPAGINPFFHVKDVMLDEGYKVFRDPYSKSPYLYSAEKHEMYTFEDEISLKEKVDYVNNYPCGGIIFWLLSGDHPQGGGTDLIDVMYKGFFL